LISGSSKTLSDRRFIEDLGQKHRTACLKELFAITFTLGAGFQKQKSRQNGAFSILSAEEVSSRLPVAPTPSGPAKPALFASLKRNR
jgi:hypothetical protein